MAKKFDKSKGKGEAKLFDLPPSKEEQHLDLVKFSFKYLILDNETFSYQDRESPYFISFIERMKHICAMKCQELKYPTVKALRNHYIDWDSTSQSSFGFKNEEQLVDRPFQFGISGNEHGRIIGFFIDSTFYVVWFDPNHAVYS